MIPRMRRVFSSHVAEIGYDSDNQELHVTWNTGRVSVYTGVPEKLANETMNAPSIGSALTDNIKGNFKHRYAV